MKTPMQEMLEWLDKMWGNASDMGMNTLDLELAMMHAKSLLDKEKEVIKNAYIEGCGDNILCESTDKKRAEEYYNETFNTKED